MVKVLIAVDGTDESTEAAALAHRLFGDDAEYLAINVYEHPPSPVEYGTTGAATPAVPPPLAWGAVWPWERRSTVPAADDEMAEFTTYDVAERAALRSAEDAGLDNAEVIGEIGDPADAILAAAHEHEVDVVVVGSHERNWLMRLFTRSVSTELVRRADVPVLVAK